MQNRYEVASGEDFFIRASIMGPPPNNKVIYAETKQDEETFTFTGTSMLSMAISICSLPYATAPAGTVANKFSTRIVAPDPGEYAFCFDNSQGVYSERDINFNIVLRIPPGVQAPDHLYTFSNPAPNQIPLSSSGGNNTTTAGPPSALEAGILTLNDKMYAVAKLVDYYGLRLHRHMYIGKALNDRVNYWGLVKSAAVLLWAGLCVYAIKSMFDNKGITI